MIPLSSSSLADSTFPLLSGQGSEVSITCMLLLATDVALALERCRVLMLGR